MKAKYCVKGLFYRLLKVLTRVNQSSFKWKMRVLNFLWLWWRHYSLAGFTIKSLERSNPVIFFCWDPIFSISTSIFFALKHLFYNKGRIWVSYFVRRKRLWMQQWRRNLELFISSEGKALNIKCIRLKLIRNLVEVLFFTKPCFPNQGGNSQYFLCKSVIFFLTLRCFYRVVIDRK